MAITVQSVLNLSDSTASPSQGYVSTPDSPFAMFFASQLQAFAFGQPGEVMAGEGIGQPLRAARGAEVAQDAAALLGGLFMAGAVPAGTQGRAAGKEITTSGAHLDAALPEAALAAEEWVAAAGAKARAATSGDSSDALSALAALTGESPRDDMPALPALLAAAGSDKRTLRALKDDGLSAAVAVRQAMREVETADGADTQTLPPGFAVGRQELPAGLAAGGIGQELKEVLLGGTMDRSKQWGEAFGLQVVKAVERQLDSARFHVTPEKLGPIEVQISMNKEQAQIVVTTANLMAKEIVESHLPTLSRMMEQAGLQLADAQVSSQQQGQQQGQQAQQQHGRSQSAAMLPPAELESAAPVAAVSSGLSVTA